MRLRQRRTGKVFQLVETVEEKLSETVAGLGERTEPASRRDMSRVRQGP